MALTARQRLLLNKVGKSQVAFTDPDMPAASSAIPLGDIIENVSDAVVNAGSYSFGVSGGAVGVFATGISIPANAIITRLWTRAITAFDSAGLATVAIKVGSQTLKAATAFDDAAYVGVDAQTLSAPVLVSADSDVTLTVADAALTDGEYRVIVEWIKP